MLQTDTIIKRTDCRRSITKFLTERKLDHPQLLQACRDRINIQVVLVDVELGTIPSGDVRIGICQMGLRWTNTSFLKRDELPITAMPSKLEVARSVGGFFASPISWL